MTEGAKFSKLTWMDAVRRCTEIHPARRLVILHIGATANPDGQRAFCSSERVEAQIGVSRNTIRRARQEAVQLGLWVETTPARGGRNGGSSAVYRLLMPPEMGVQRWHPFT